MKGGRDAATTMRGAEDARALVIEARSIVHALHARETDITPPRLTLAGHHIAAVLAEAIRALYTAEQELIEATEAPT